MNANLNTAQQIVVSLMIEEKAIQTSRTQFDSEICEVRLAQELADANALLSNWHQEATKLMRHKSSIEQDLHKMYQKDIDENSKGYRFYAASVRSLEKTREYLILAIAELAEAIVYLESYINPSCGGGDSESLLDVPFESATFSTPKEAAEALVNAVLDARGDEIYQEWYERHELGVHTDDAAIYDILFQAGEDSFEQNHVGAEYLDMYIDCPEFSSIRTLFEIEMFEKS